MKLCVALVTLLYVSQHALGVEVEVYEGAESVLLPCQVTVSVSQFNAVLWSLEHLSDQVVHQRDQRGDKLTDQNQKYRGRTSMRPDALKTGDLSLTLRNPTIADSDTYTCIYKEGLDTNSRQEVHLKVRVKQQVEVVEWAESVLLPFKTTADLPEDIRVEWTDRDNMKVHVYQNGSVEQDQVYRGRTEMNEDLKTGDFSLILRHPTVRDRGRYTCRVYNKDEDLLRGTRVELKVKVHPWKTVVAVLAVLAGLLAAAVGAFILFMWWDGRRVKEEEVEEGAGSVQLPFRWTDTWWVKMRMCRIRGDLSKDVRVEWTDKDNRKVHVYQNGSVEQDQVYRGRTEMNEDLMKTGDFSLTLRHPTVRDRGYYYCRVYNKDGDLLRERRVDVKVKGRQVEVVEGAESVLLPFKTTADLPKDIRVEWRDHHYRKVHVYQNGSDQPVEQDQDYRDRTEMKKDLMETGDFSLILRHPTERDRGRYTCRVYKDRDLLRERRVELKVKVQQVEVESGTESVQLSFKTTADLPEDIRVEWTDEDNRKVHVYPHGSVEQHQVYRGRTEMKKDLMKTGDFSLILRHITVRDRGDYSCRVYNKDRDLLRERRVELKVKGQQVELEVESGAESVQLPFKTTADLPDDVRVEWMDYCNMKVHVYQNGSVEQDQDYRGRTEMNEDLKTGDFSLILRHPTERDRGDYTCRVYNKDRDLLRGTRVELKVKVQQVVAMKGMKSVLLPVKAMTDLHEDVRVEWTNISERKVHVYDSNNSLVGQDLIYKGRTRMNGDRNIGNFTLTLIKPSVSDTGYYTCRVYNKEGDLLRETGVELWVKEGPAKKKQVTSGKEAAPLMADEAV